MADGKSSASRPWTVEEDELLREGVARHGEQDSWKTVALMIPGRTNKACRKRWLHSLSPAVKKCAWSLEEDQLLIKLHKQYDTKWSCIARHIPGRTDDACSKRYREALDPNLKKEPWSLEEEQILMDTFDKLGNQWVEISKILRRSGLDCRNRWRMVARKRAKQLELASPDPCIDPRLAQEPAMPAMTSAAFFAPADGSNVLSLSIEGASPDWPYYPAEAYPSLTQEENQQTHAFHEPTPEYSISPQIAPFQFSSSSLSTALSAPLRSRPLPSEHTDTSHVNHLQPIYHSHSQPQSQVTSPLTFHNPINNEDVTMSQDDEFDTSMDQQDSGLLLQHLNFNGPLVSLPFQFFNQDSFPSDPGIHQAASPISPSGLSLPDPLYFGEPFKSPGLFSTLFQPQQGYSPSPLQTCSSYTSDLLDDLSSTASTPFITTSLSATPSPIPGAAPPLSDAPGSPDQATNGSLLFSVPHPPSLRNPVRSKKRKKIAEEASKEATQPRLSSTLMFAEEHIRPYGCGYERCSSAADPGATCYRSSGELGMHNAVEHPFENEQGDKEGDASGGPKPFRCNLADCGKSYKTLNGLQYHIQVSREHYKDALQFPGDGKFVCPTCGKSYRKSHGLKYHLDNGHPSKKPAQMLELPPMMGRHAPKKPKKTPPTGLEAGLPLMTA